MLSEGDHVRVDFAAGTIENLRTGAELVTSEPVPPELLAIVESGGVLNSLERQGYLPAIETGA